MRDSRGPSFSENGSYVMHLRYLRRRRHHQVQLLLPPWKALNRPHVLLWVSRASNNADLKSA